MKAGALVLLRPSVIATIDAIHSDRSAGDTPTASGVAELYDRYIVDAARGG